MMEKLRYAVYLYVSDIIKKEKNLYADVDP